MPTVDPVEITKLPGTYEKLVGMDSSAKLQTWFSLYE